MYHALVPVDDREERARTQAEAVADLPSDGEETRATVLRVFDSEAQAEATVATETEAGETALEVLTDAGVTVEARSRHGDPAEEILAVARNDDVDAIVVGGRQRSSLGRLVFGSVSEAVTVEATRPVLVTGTESRKRPTHRCQNCGETYYFEEENPMTGCRRCGDARVEPID